MNIPEIDNNKLEKITDKTLCNRNIIQKTKNSCTTYFRITGNFNPDDISKMLGLVPAVKWKKGDKRKNGSEYDFSAWHSEKYSEYDVYVENMMMKTIEPFLDKTDILKEIRTKYNADLTLEVVPIIYANQEANPCLAPSDEVIKFLFETGSHMDIDLYVNNSYDE